jgi:hypothetical protein
MLAVLWFNRFLTVAASVGITCFTHRYIGALVLFLLGRKFNVALREARFPLQWYLRMHQMARIPSFQLIFFPSAQVRPE